LASRTGGSYDIAILGHGTGAMAETLAGYGAGTVHVLDGEAYTHYLAQTWAMSVAQLVDASGASTVVCSAGSMGKGFLPRVAAIKGWGMVADCVGLAGDGADLLYERPMYAGNIIATVKVNTAGAVISVRGSEFDAVSPSGGQSNIAPFTADVGGVTARYVGFEGVESERPELTEADIVVSGGRGLKDGDNFFTIMEPLADALGAAIGASRAAVDSGFCPNDFQVGQTGKVVAPKLYIAVALSGAIQHLAGMKNSKTIVAINKDPEAPIFQLTDYGLVADAFTAVPELVEKLKAL
ncbi:MAG: electron transfer flavoprotein subunit alpha/FixB family protein, partial [Myxococcota bacterium]|nr:electron transfer flavoprotein subunit alpha/FixB family protein [Myxococcota bacterium]